MFFRMLNDCPILRRRSFLMLDFCKRTGRAAIKFICSRAFLGTVLALITTAAILTSAAAVTTVTVYDGNEVKTVKTYSVDPDTILSMAGINVSEDDRVSAEGLGTADGVIRISRAFEVTVTYGSERLTATVADGTVSDVLSKLNITLGEHDIISAELTDTVSAGMFIDIISVGYDTYTAEESIAPATDTVYSDQLPEGEETVTEGQPGVKMVTYKNKLVNGNVTETAAVSETVVKEPVNAVKTIGTKKAAAETVAANSGAYSEAGASQANTQAPTVGSKRYSSLNTVSTLAPDYDFELDDNNRPVNYSRVITGRATAYYETGLTATGKRCRPGYVAVNPKQIPYGSKLYIRTTDGSYIYGYASAEDTGGFAGGRTVVDLFFPSIGACYNFGARNVEIYVLD